MSHPELFDLTMYARCCSHYILEHVTTLPQRGLNSGSTCVPCKLVKHYTKDLFAGARATYTAYSQYYYICFTFLSGKPEDWKRTSISSPCFLKVESVRGWTWNWKSLKEYSREVLAQESADLTQGPLMSSCKHFWSYVNIFEVKQLADDVIILKLIVTSSFFR